MNKKLIVVILLTIALLLSGCIETIRDGKHAAQITAFETEGVIWKTHAIYVKSDVSSSQEEIYCLENTSLIPEVIRLAETRAKVTIVYRNELIVAPWRCGFHSGNYGGIITGVIS